MRRKTSLTKVRTFNLKDEENVPPDSVQRARWLIEPIFRCRTHWLFPKSIPHERRPEVMFDHESAVRD